MFELGTAIFGVLPLIIILLIILAFVRLVANYRSTQKKLNQIIELVEVLKNKIDN
ncbi:hypothetical protein N007_13810 [Alicyclobacillus acidoterrestris ATCC 49025]|nr:hypothetical protein N007_13810 [Alicyclobacillus acidoterrestris ATCC 49025]